MVPSQIELNSPANTETRRMRLIVIAIGISIVMTGWHFLHVQETAVQAAQSRQRRVQAQQLISELKTLTKEGQVEKVVAEEGFLAYPYIREIAAQVGFDININFESLGTSNMGDGSTIRHDLEIRVASSVDLERLTLFLLALSTSEVPVQCSRIELSQDQVRPTTNDFDEDQEELWRVERLVVSYLAHSNG